MTLSLTGKRTVHQSKVEISSNELSYKEREMGMVTCLVSHRYSIESSFIRSLFTGHRCIFTSEHYLPMYYLPVSCTPYLYPRGLFTGHRIIFTRTIHNLPVPQASSPSAISPAPIPCTLCTVPRHRYHLPVTTYQYLRSVCGVSRGHARPTPSAASRSDGLTPRPHPYTNRKVSMRPVYMYKKGYGRHSFGITQPASSLTMILGLMGHHSGKSPCPLQSRHRTFSFASSSALR
jgi:hypothetical protein